MRVLYILGFPNPFPGAAWTRIGFFADAWSKKGHQIEALGIFSYKSLPKRGVRKPGKVNIFNLIFNIGLNHPLIFALNSVISFMVSTLFLTARKPNVVIVSVPTGDIGLGALIACKLTGVKCAVDYRDEWEDYAISLNNSKIGKSFYSAVKKLMASLYTKCNLAVAVTPSFITSLKHRGVISVRFVPNGADVTVFNPYPKHAVRKKLGLNENELIIVYSGAIGGYSKLDIVIRALAKLHDLIRDIKFLIIGEGPDLPFILRLSKKLGLHNKVLYLGVKNDKNEIAEILAAGDIGIIPGAYTKGQLPAKFFEYCSCGVPVIATVYYDSILAKLIKEHKVGLTVPAMDEEKLAEATYWIYKNESFRKAASKRARSLIEEKFDRNKIAQEFLDLVKALL